jgi:hypothetical protein
MSSETKIFNLDSNEFDSNPPFKKMSRHFHFATQKPREQKFKKMKNVSFFLAGTGALKNPNSKTWNFLAN